MLGRDCRLHRPHLLSLGGWEGTDGTIAAAASLGGMSWKKYFKNIQYLGNTDFLKSICQRNPLYFSLHWFD